MDDKGVVYSFLADSAKHSPVQGFTLWADEQNLYKLDFLLRSDEIPDGCRPVANALHHEAKAQIKAYLDGRLRCFDLPYVLKGSEFQRSVWSIISGIPYGKIVSYGKIAETLGGRGISQAVGQAANKNPLPLIVPCHRVVGAKGQMTGFAPGIAVKSFLLGLERGGVLW